jgi:DNA mismatch endonuclease, patch repair protein
MAETSPYRKTPQFRGLKPASAQSSAVKSKNRAKHSTSELLLRRALWKRGLRYRLHAPNLPGKPDIVFPSKQVAIFCDGDFWHGRNWPERKKALSKGANAEYWVAKIEANMDRDCAHVRALEERGWLVLRFWETEIKAAPDTVADVVEQAWHARSKKRRKS